MAVQAQMRPIPEGLVNFARSTHMAFQARIAGDESFRAFVGQHDDQITQLMKVVQVAIRSFSQSPEGIADAKKLFNGPVQLMVNRPAGDSIEMEIGQMAGADLENRASISDEELDATFRDWSLRGVAYTQTYVLNTGFPELHARLTSCKGIKATFIALPAEGRTGMGFIFKP